MSGLTVCFQELIDAKGDVGAMDRKKKNTPLHMACEKGHIEAIKVSAV